PKIPSPRNTHRHRPKMSIQYIDFHAGNAAPNGNNRLLAPRLTSPGGDVDGRLCWPIEVVQFGSPQASEEPLLDFAWQGLATRNYSLNAPRLQPVDLQEDLQHGRYKVQGGDLFARNQIHQIIRLSVSSRLR